MLKEKIGNQLIAARTLLDVITNYVADTDSISTMSWAEYEKQKVAQEQTVSKLGTLLVEILTQVDDAAEVWKTEWDTAFSYYDNYNNGESFNPDEVDQEAVVSEMVALGVNEALAQQIAASLGTSIDS